METIKEIPESKRWSKAKLDTVYFLISLACGILFLYTAQTKLMDHGRFMKGIARIALIGPYAVLISWAVPFLELVIAILLFIPRTSRLGLKGFLAMMVVFSGYISTVLLWAEKLPCHCGGVIESLSWTAHLWFNVGFIALAMMGLWLSKKLDN